MNRKILSLFSVLAVSLVAGSAFAVDLTSVTFAEANTTIGTALASPMTMGITIGASVFAILYGWRLLRRAAK